MQVRITTAAFIGILSLSGASSLGAPAQFVLDPSQSRLKVEIIALGRLQPQQTNSDWTSFNGSLFTNLDTSSIQFLPATILDAVLQPAVQEPGLMGVDGTAPADYGLLMDGFTRQSDGTFVQTTKIRVAIRDIVMSLSTADSTPLTGTSFVSTGQAFVVTAGAVDYQAFVDPLINEKGRESLVNEKGNNASTMPGSLVTVGSTQTLTEQVDVTIFTSVQSDNDTQIHITGQLLGTRAVPEPTGAVLMLGTGMFLLLGQRRWVGRTRRLPGTGL